MVQFAFGTYGTLRNRSLNATILVAVRFSPCAFCFRCSKLDRGSVAVYIPSWTSEIAKRQHTTTKSDRNDDDNNHVVC